MSNNILPYSIRLRVDSVVHSRQIQETLFALGYKWQNKDSLTIQYINLPFLCAHPTGYIKYIDDEDYYNGLDYTEVSLYDLSNSFYGISNTINFDKIKIDIADLTNIINT